MIIIEQFKIIKIKNFTQKKKLFKQKFQIQKKKNKRNKQFI